MSAYGKVSLIENDNVSKEVMSEDFNQESVVEEQVGKFDTTYTAEKLQELYNEYDKITLDQEKISSLTQIKTNVVSNKVPFRVALVMSTTVIVTLLLAFLCIYNIFVINGMSTNINYLQEEVASCEYDLVTAEGLYENYTSSTNIENKLTEKHFSSENVTTATVSVPNKVEVIELQGETNWFDAFCNFVSHIFG